MDQIMFLISQINKKNFNYYYYNKMANIEFMEFLLQIANENDKLTTSQKDDVNNLITEHKRLVEENDKHYQNLLDKQEQSNKEKEIQIVEILDNPMQLKRI